MKPFVEHIIDTNVVIRTFKSDIDESELKWHWDEEDRSVTPLNENDWEFQFDNELPFKINREINIPAGVIHRVIAGSGDLIIKIVKNEVHKTF